MLKKYLLFNSQKKKTFFNQYYIYLINIFHFFIYVFPYPIYKLFFRIIGLRIGKNSSLDLKVFIKFPWLVEIGDNVSINRGVEFFSDLAGSKKIMIKKNVKIAPNVKFYASGHVISPDKRDEHSGGDIIIEENVWIGANSIISAGSIVNKSVPKNQIWGGSPAKYISNIEK